MAGTLTRAQPTGEAVRNMIAAGTGGNASARVFVPQTVIVPIAATATLTAWINPEVGTVLTQNVMVFYTTGGTGTIDVGRTSDGTAAANGIIDGGTMVAGVLTRPDAASSTAGTAPFDKLLIGPGGTGTNNSITVADNEAGTGTAVGFLAVTYARIAG